MGNRKTIEEYQAECRPMHFKKRASKILEEMGRKKEAIEFVDKIIQHVEVTFKNDRYKNLFLYWCSVRNELNSNYI